MINFHDAILAINSSIVTIRGNVAYDANENVVEYDLEAAQAKLAELQAAEVAAQEAAAAHKESALAKLAAIGLSTDEIKALLG